MPIYEVYYLFLNEQIVNIETPEEYD